LLWIVLLLLGVFAGCGKASKQPPFQAATSAEQLERLTWQAVQDKNWTEFEHHIAPMFTGVNSAGQALDHAAWLEYWENEQLKDFSLGDVTTQPAGTDMVATYVLHFHGGDAGHSSPAGGVRVVSVWQEVKKGWILISQSQTPIAP
jgi:hypothetical protein